MTKVDEIIDKLENKESKINKYMSENIDSNHQDKSKSFQLLENQIDKHIDVFKRLKDR